jgi:hypothetical protein
MPNEADSVNMDFMEAALTAAGFDDEQPPAPTPQSGNGYHAPFDMPAFVTRHGLRVKTIKQDGAYGTKYILDECPFDPTHKAPDSYCGVMPSGAPYFKCSHASCAGYKWQQLRERFEPGYRNKSQQQQPNGQHHRHGPEQASEPDLPLPPTCRELYRDFPTLRPHIIHGLLREGETLNCIAAPKLGKSWLAINAALCVVTGKRFLSTFGTSPGNVLIVDNELHSETIAHRVPKVAEALGITTDEYADALRVQSLRGQLRDINGLGTLLLKFEPGQFKLIVVDAFYRCLPRGTDENSNADVAQLYNTIDTYADRLRCAFMLIHHSTKGNQAGKSTTDIGAGAGSQSRATDTHLVLRPHSEPDAVVLEAAARSWPPVEPICLRWKFPIWQIDEDLDPALLKTDRPPKSAKAAPVASGGVPFDPAKPTKFQQTLSRVMELLTTNGPMTKNALKEEIGASGKTIKETTDALLEFGRIEPFDVETTRGMFPGFRVSTTDGGQTPDKPRTVHGVSTADTTTPDTAPLEGCAVVSGVVGVLPAEAADDFCPGSDADEVRA